MKKSDMLILWKDWKTRPVETTQYDHDLVQSVHEVSCDDVDTTMDQTTNNQDGVENGMEILNLFCLTMEWYKSFRIAFGFWVLVAIATLGILPLC